MVLLYTKKKTAQVFFFFFLIPGDKIEISKYFISNSRPFIAACRLFTTNEWFHSGPTNKNNKISF
jgi:hypothetical protein